MNTDFKDKLAEFVWEHAVAPMCFVGKDGSFLRVNPALGELLGYTPKEMTSLTFQQITHPQDLEADMDMVMLCIEGKLDGYSMTKRYITKRGETIWIRLRVDVIKDEQTNELMLFLSQITPKEDPIRLEAMLNRKGYTTPSVSVEPAAITIGQLGTWLTKNWKSLIPIFASVGFVIFYVLKNFYEYFHSTGSG